MADESGKQCRTVRGECEAGVLVLGGRNAYDGRRAVVVVVEEEQEDGAWIFFFSDTTDGAGDLHRPRRQQQHTVLQRVGGALNSRSEGAVSRPTASQQGYGLAAAPQHSSFAGDWKVAAAV